MVELGLPSSLPQALVTVGQAIFIWPVIKLSLLGFYRQSVGKRLLTKGILTVHRYE